MFDSWIRLGAAASAGLIGMSAAAVSAVAQGDGAVAPLGLPAVGGDPLSGPEAVSPPTPGESRGAVAPGAVTNPSGPLTDAEAARLMMRLQEQLMFLQLELKGEQLRNEIQKMRNDRLIEALQTQRGVPGQ